VIPFLPFMNLTAFLKPVPFRRWMPLVLAVLVSGCATEKKLTPTDEKFMAAAKKKMDLPLIALAPGHFDPEIDMGPPWGYMRQSEVKKRMREIERKERQQSQEGPRQDSQSQ